MANSSPEAWRAKDYTSVSQNDEPVASSSEPYRVPGKADSAGGPSRESSQQDSPLLSAEDLGSDIDPALDGAAHDYVNWDDDREKSKSSFYLFLLTISIGGYA